MVIPKCIYPKSIFAKCTRLACLLSFASVFLSKSLYSLTYNNLALPPNFSAKLALSFRRFSWRGKTYVLPCSLKLLNLTKSNFVILWNKRSKAFEEPYQISSQNLGQINFPENCIHFISYQKELLKSAKSDKI